MKAIKQYSLLFLLLFYSIGKAQEPPSSEEYNYNTFEAQKKWIVGTFVSDDDSNWKMQFTKDSRCINSYIGGSTDEYTYTIEYSTKKSDVPAGYENIYTLYLKAVPANPNEDLTYEMYVADDGLALYPWPMGIGGQFTLERVKPKESKPKPSAELEEESEPLLKRGFKLSDYDRGYFDGGLAYQQCKEEQDKEDRDIFDRYRRMPIEGMEWESKAPKLGLGDCREEAFERIKMSTKEYRDGFEKGWRDASMPLNKEKETTKKK